MFYEENRHLEESDIGHDSPAYHIILYDKPFLIALGKERRLIQKKNTYYYPVYLLNKMNVQSQIGAFEFVSSNDSVESRAKPFVDSEGDIDLNRLGDIVLYSFANSEYFDNATIDITPMELKELEAKYLVSKVKENEGEDDNEDNDDGNEPRPFELGTISQEKSLTTTRKVLKEGVFTIDKTTKRLALLPEETKESAKETKADYSERSKSQWIEKYMENGHFDIVETNNNGDCLFDTVRLAFDQIGYQTSVEKLRALVAKEATDEMLMEYKMLYQSTLAEIADTEKALRKMVVENKNLKARLKTIPVEEKPKRAEIIKTATEIKEQHHTLVGKQQENRRFLSEFEFMKGIDTIEQFRAVIQTPVYWADNFAINVLEKELNIKLLIFSEEDYDENDENNVIRCSISSENGITSPDYYIMTSYSGKHYRLISYRAKRILTFSEIPYDVKTMVVIKCMEKNSGGFAQIQDFKNFKSKLGVMDTEEEEEDVTGGEIFAFYSQSGGSARAGKGPNESIRTEKIHEYMDLNIKENNDWRKKLDDDWSTNFTVDNKRWKTVEHYYQASKFKKHNPHFYNMFSLDDTSSDIAKDVALAKAAGSQKGIYKKGKKEIPLRPTEIHIDSDFYGSRRFEEREKALYAKFTQNADLKSILLATKSAVLKQYIPRQVAKRDKLLMEVREKIQKEN